MPSESERQGVPRRAGMEGGKRVGGGEEGRMEETFALLLLLRLPTFEHCPFGFGSESEGGREDGGYTCTIRMCAGKQVDWDIYITTHLPPQQPPPWVPLSVLRCCIPPAAPGPPAAPPPAPMWPVVCSRLYLLISRTRLLKASSTLIRCLALVSMKRHPKCFANSRPSAIARSRGVSRAQRVSAGSHNRLTMAANLPLVL